MSVQTWRLMFSAVEKLSVFLQLYLAIKEKYFSDENDDNVDATRRKLTEYFQKTMK